MNNIDQYFLKNEFMYDVLYFKIMNQNHDFKYICFVGNGRIRM